jgi:hypothetical protein
MKLLHSDLARGDFKPRAQPVAKALHDHSLVFERLRVLDVDLEESDSNDHVLD